jgi:HEAT repeat protein
MKRAFLAAAVTGGWLGLVRAEEPRTFYGKTVEGWIAVFRDEEATVQDRRNAAEALAAFGPAASAAAPQLIAALHDPELKTVAIAALSRMNAFRERHVPILIEQFINECCLPFIPRDSLARGTTAGGALVRVGEPAVPALINVLRSTNSAAQAGAVSALGLVGPQARTAVPWLIRILEHPEVPDDREPLAYRAVQALGQIGPDAVSAVPALNQLFGKDVVPDDVIITALERIGAPPTRNWVEDLLRGTDSGMVHYLIRLGPRAREAVPALKKALSNPEPQVRYNSAAALAFNEPAVAEAIPVLLDALGHYGGNDLDVSDVPNALARFGRRASAAIPKLAELVIGGSSDQALFEALVEVDPDGTQCVPVLIAALEDADADVVAIAADCLGLLGPRAKTAVPALARALSRDFENDQLLDMHKPFVSAVTALRRIGPGAKGAIPILIGLLSSDRAEVSVDAVAETLGSFGAEARAAVPALIETIRNGEQIEGFWIICPQAILALGQIGPDARSAIPVLQSLLKDDERFGAYAPEILAALYQLDPAAKQLADNWLDTQPAHEVARPWIRTQLERRAIVLGAMSRSSFETDWLTQGYLDHLDSDLQTPCQTDEDANEAIEETLETLGRFGPAARLAIPRLCELRKHPSPFVRLWAAEALAKLQSPAQPATAHVSLRLNQAR